MTKKRFVCAYCGGVEPAQLKEQLDRIEKNIDVIKTWQSNSQSYMINRFLDIEKKLDALDERATAIANLYGQDFMRKLEKKSKGRKE